MPNRLLILACFAVLSGFARSKAAGYCQPGGATVLVSETGDTISTAKAAYKSCEVAVYVSGTHTIAPIFRNSSGAALENPFTAAPDGSWFFYSSAGTYDVRFHGGGIRAPTQNGREIRLVTAAPYHARCDGSTDDTAAIQTALNTAQTIRFPGAACLTNPLFVLSDSVLLFSSGTVIRSKAGYVPGQSVLNLIDVSNVAIFGNSGKILMNKSEYEASSEFRMGLILRGATDVRVYDLLSSSAGGDGFYIGAGAANNPSRNISFVNCKADNNNRNGMSITSGVNVRVEGGAFTSTRGTAPGVGIDVEPNLGQDAKIVDIDIIGVTTRNNEGGGLLVVPGPIAAVPDQSVSVNIRDYSSFNDGGRAGFSGAGILIGNGFKSPGFPTGGQIAVRNATIRNPWSAGVAIFRLNSNSPTVILDSVAVLNPNRGGISALRLWNGWTAGEYAAAANSGFVVGADSDLPSADSAPIVIRNCSARDLRAAPTMRHDFYFHRANSRP